MAALAGAGLLFIILMIGSGLIISLFDNAVLWFALPLYLLKG